MQRQTTDIDELAARCDVAFPELDETDRRIALALYRTLAAGAPAEPHDVGSAAGAATDDVDHALDRWPGVYRDAQGRVIGFWGLALQPMDHGLVMDDRVLYAWCAWDALFLPEILGRDVRVESRCPATDRSIRLMVRADGPSDLDPPEAVVSMLDPECADVEGDAVLSSFCHHIRFLASREVGERWIEERGDGGFLLTVEEAWELGRAVNRRRYGDLSRP